MASSISRSFPTPESPLGKLLYDPEYKAAFHRRLQGSNFWVVIFYRLGLLPLLGAARSTMLLFTLGRKSGKVRIFPIGYFRIGGKIHVISAWAREANWYKNLQAHPQEATIQIGFRAFPVHADVLTDPAEIRATVEKLIQEDPKSAQRLFGWDPQQDRLEAADFTPMVERVLFVRFTKRS